VKSHNYKIKFDQIFDKIPQALFSTRYMALDIPQIEQNQAFSARIVSTSRDSLDFQINCSKYSLVKKVDFEFMVIDLENAVEIGQINQERLNTDKPNHFKINFRK
jgi:hypothetical protein